MECSACTGRRTVLVNYYSCNSLYLQHVMSLLVFVPQLSFHKSTWLKLYIHGWDTHLSVLNIRKGTHVDRHFFEHCSFT